MAVGGAAQRSLRVVVRRPQAGEPRRRLTQWLKEFYAPAYDVIDVSGTTIGTIERVLGERQYRVSDSSGAEPMVVVQEHEYTTVKGWMTSSRPFAADRFAFWRGDQRLGWHEPSRSPGQSTLDMTIDGEHVIDRRLALAVSCLDLLRIRQED